MQIAGEVPEGSGSAGGEVPDGSGADTIADRVAEVSVAHSRQSSEGFRYKILPRSSKLLGITHEFIGPPS